MIVPASSVFEAYRVALRERGQPVTLMLAATMRKERVVDLDACAAVEAAELASMRRPDDGTP